MCYDLHFFISFFIFQTMASELNMYESQVQDYKYDIERLSRELQDIKKKYFLQKKREQQQRYDTLILLWHGFFLSNILFLRIYSLADFFQHDVVLTSTFTVILTYQKDFLSSNIFLSKFQEQCHIIWPLIDLIIF